MNCQDEVIRIGKKLEKMISGKTSNDAIALDLLKALRNQPMTLDVLQDTRIGMSVNNYRKLSKNEEVLSLAKGLIKTWKKLLASTEAASSSSASSSNSKSGKNLSASSTSRSSSYRGDDTDSLDSSQNDVTVTSGKNSSPKNESMRGDDSPLVTGNTAIDTVRGGTVSSLPRANLYTTDGVRLKCRELLETALNSGEKLDGFGDIEHMAAELEECIYQEFKNTDMKYKNRIRSRVINLKDVKNPRLRENFLLGQISAKRMATMTPEDMASEALRTLRAKLTKEAIDEHQMATQSGTKSDLFKCGKCGMRDTMYNQVQTRSADEPMTTFVLCNHCGNRWKFC